MPRTGFSMSLHLARVSGQILSDGDDRQAWLLSAAKWMEVKVHSGSYGVMLSVQKKDKHRLKVEKMKGDKKD